jgi:hypothetical protein
MYISSCHISICSDINQLQRMVSARSASSARRALSFARAVRNTLQAKDDYTTMCITEAEEYLGLLREKKTSIKSQLAEAHEQIVLVKEVLDSDGISEISCSDDEDSMSSASSPPRFSDFLPLESVDTEVISDHDHDLNLGTTRTSSQWGPSSSSSPPTSYLGDSQGGKDLQRVEAAAAEA